MDLALDTLNGISGNDKAATLARASLPEADAVTTTDEATAPQSARLIPPVPRITVHAFCERDATADAIKLASADRLMARADVSVHPGGLAAAPAHYDNGTTPNLIIVEGVASERVLTDLDRLAEVCEVGTKVMVIGYSNDIAFYREIIKRGVSEYVIGPVEPTGIIAAISGIYRHEKAERLGRSYAFIGARGGVGSSTIAHNVAWALARRTQASVVVADMDLPFGTAGLDFNVDPTQGLADAVQDASRLDTVLLDRILAECGERVSLLSAPANLEHSHDLHEAVFEPLIEIAQSHVPSLVLDVPHVWTAWSRKVLVAADEVVITATPDLTSLRNAKNLVAFLRHARPNDPLPKLVLNQVGVPKRPEVKTKDFTAALSIEPAATINFEPKLFGTAANNGQMIAQVAAKARAVEAFGKIAEVLTAQDPNKRRPATKLALLKGMLKGKRR
jgi:pilus assembly protein CpaE